MLEIRNLSAGYGDVPVLRDISACITKGQVTAILGPNGCGKTTLLKVLCGILKADSGQVLLNGGEIGTMDPKALARQIAYLSQSRQVPDISVKRLVLHGRFPYLSYPRRYRPQDHVIARSAMEQMGISCLAEEYLDRLSGGQRQKAYIAMALAQDTPVILLDEPTTYLDIRHQLQMMDQARLLARQGKTVVMVVHDLSLGLSVADRVLLMDRGALVAEGTPESVFSSGQLQKVFKVEVGRIKTENGWKYYCEMPMEDM